MNLIAYRVRHITPIQHDWLRSLSDIVEKYFVYVQFLTRVSLLRVKTFGYALFLLTLLYHYQIKGLSYFDTVTG